MSRHIIIRTVLAGSAVAVLAALTGCGGPGHAAAGASSSASGSVTPLTPSPSSPSSSAAPGSTSPAPPKSTSGDNVPPGGTVKASPVLEYYTGAKDRSIALTFDDGPSPVWTPKILAVLAKYHAHATFCEIGPNARANLAMVKAIRAAGDRLCDHSVSHNEAMSKWSIARQTYEIAGAQAMIEAAGGSGTEVGWFRAPGGDFSPLNRQIAAEHGLRPLAWSVDSEDWKRPGVAKILGNVHRELSNGAIVLMHDGGGDRSQTVAALKQLLPQLVHAGYAFDFPAK
ncbi:polysaccharide deacetylase family protein [Streptacidiphilus cavernicola]|uniref:Polysaccharide deacetylase family protein n=1 Tax=Streptacidiphilus cavernicola TaxID=3342716 RepID=A0ABV6VWL8_9ACTN